MAKPMQKIYLQFRLLAVAVLTLGVVLQSLTLAHAGRSPADRFTSANGEIAVSQVTQMSVVINAPSGTIYTDPAIAASRYAGHPAPDVILISHEHHEHYNADTLEDLVGSDTRLVVPPYVMERLPDRLRSKAVSLANGEKSDLGSIAIEAIPAHGLAGQSAEWHPPGRGNGYVVTVDGQRLYIAGSTDAVPEMLELKDIDIAFLPLYPPYALGIDEAVEAVSMFDPKVAYIYQYKNVRIRDEFVRKMQARSSAVAVIARDID